VILDDAPETLTAARWGSCRRGRTGQGRPDPINARAETLTEKRYFREAFDERRCLVPADGFFEWVETADGKRPHYVSRADGRPFLLAGLWETWTPEQTQTGLGSSAPEVRAGRPRQSSRSLSSRRSRTTFSAAYHHRMALLLDREAGERWLTADDPSDLLAPSAVDLQAWPVSEAVNDPRTTARTWSRRWPDHPT